MDAGGQPGPEAAAGGEALRSARLPTDDPAMATVIQGVPEDASFGRDVPLSPELALVDPDLAAWARAQLQPPADILQRPTSVEGVPDAATSNGSATLEANRSPGAEERIATRIEAPAPPPDPRSTLPRTRKRVRDLPLAVRLLAVVGGAAALLFGLASIPDEQPTIDGGEAVPRLEAPRASAPSAVSSSVGRPQEPGATARAESPPSTRERPTASARPRVTPARGAKAAAQRRAAERNRRQQPKPSAEPATSPSNDRRFAWAPVAGAQSYEVAFYRGNDRIYVARTETPKLELPSRWRHNGRWMSLTRGAYRWYVWVVGADGERRTAAVVQARLVVGGT
jgi:hypothetical protein